MKDEYYKTKASVEEYVRLAKDVNGAALIDKLKSYLPKRAALLEMGSGPGTDWKILNEAYQVTGSDNSNEFIQYLKSTYPLGRFLELDAVSLNTEDTFDGIYSNKVLHHLSDDELQRSIKRQHDILHDGGVICHSFWKGEGSEIFKGLFVNYHSEKGIQNFFESHFESLLLLSYAEFEKGDSILFLGKKKSF
jgi:cyclopropane fatty-acyl-phospholipid synthase-like methyltransferase